jgi:hypothetical protein
MSRICTNHQRLLKEKVFGLLGGNAVGVPVLRCIVFIPFKTSAAFELIFRPHTDKYISSIYVRSDGRCCRNVLDSLISTRSGGGKLGQTFGNLITDRAGGHVVAYRLCRDQVAAFRVVDHIRDGPIPDAPDRFVNHMQRDQEPLPRAHRLSEMIVNRKI